MLRNVLIEILWVLIFAFLFGAIALSLTGCNSEGAGFSNSGAYARQKLCRYVDARGNERWVTAPADGVCR